MTPTADFGRVTAPLPSDGYNQPPPWPPSNDPRTPKCRHTWDHLWGKKGERQRQCKHCKRWIWDHSILPPIDRDSDE